MSIVKPPTAIHTISKRDDTLEIIIPTTKKWLQITFLSFWLIFWVFGELAVLGIFIASTFQGLSAGLAQAATSGPPALFLLIWLIGWTIGGSFALYAWLWQLAGKEKILVNNEGFIISRQVLKFSRSKEYLHAHITSLRVSPESFNPFDWSKSMRFWGIGGGVLAFDYGAKTFRFGNGIDEAEAKQIFNEIQLLFPKYLKEI